MDTFYKVDRHFFSNKEDAEEYEHISENEDHNFQIVHFDNHIGPIVYLHSGAEAALFENSMTEGDEENYPSVFFIGEGWYVYAGITQSIYPSGYSETIVKYGYYNMNVIFETFNRLYQTYNDALSALSQAGVDI